MLHQQANNDANRNKEVEKSKVLKVGKRMAAAAFFFASVYPVIVVVRQALSVESHPPPLKNTLPAVKEKINKMMNANVIHLAHSVSKTPVK